MFRFKFLILSVLFLFVSSIGFSADTIRTAGRPLGSLSNIEIIDSEKDRAAIHVGMESSLNGKMGVLLSMEFTGFVDNSGFDEKRYLWVTGSMVTKKINGKITPSYVNLSMTPVSYNWEDADYKRMEFQVLNTTYQRDIEIGLNHGVTIRAVGLHYGIHPKDKNQTWAPFLDMVMDFAGFNWMSNVAGDTGKNFTVVTAHLVGAQMAGGLQWNANKTISVRISVGGRADLNFGLGKSAIYDAYSRLSAVFRLKALHLSASLQVGYTGVIANRDEDDGGPGNYGSRGYVTFGVGTSF